MLLKNLKVYFHDVPKYLVDLAFLINFESV